MSERKKLPMVPDVQPERKKLTNVAPDGRPDAEQPRWRKDFPIDLAQDHYVARRDFTKFMILISFAFAIGQLWICVQNLFRRGKELPPKYKITALDKLPIGGSLIFSYPEETDKCVLVRMDEEHFVAYDQKCTHLSCAVVPEPKANRLVCPCHEGCFDLAQGEPIAGPPRRPLKRIKLEILYGAIYATGVEGKVV